MKRCRRHLGAARHSAAPYPLLDEQSRRTQAASRAFGHDVALARTESSLASCFGAASDYAGAALSGGTGQARRNDGRYPVRETLMASLRGELRQHFDNDDAGAFHQTILNAITQGVLANPRESTRLEPFLYEQAVEYMLPVHVFTQLKTVADEGCQVFRCLQNPASYIRRSIDQFRATSSFTIGLDSNRGLLVKIYSYTLIMEKMLDIATQEQAAAELMVPLDIYTNPRPAGSFGHFKISPADVVIMQAALAGLNEMFHVLLNEQDMNKAEQLAHSCTPALQVFFAAPPYAEVSREEANRRVCDCFVRMPQCFRMGALFQALEES